MGDYRPLPEEAVRLLASVGAPPRLVAHGELVHDTAAEILAWLRRAHPDLRVDTEAVRFGAALHDVGKARHTGELTGPGHRHEVAGERMLRDRGVPPDLARFCATHGDWSAPGRALEDLLVSLADKVWKGARVAGLELAVTRRIAETAGEPEWEVYMGLDDELRVLAERADERLAHQARHPVVPPGTAAGE
ncbi:HD domain-containing protein [Nocardiopsis ganjiahuensis]|uniref:HD domain-containing protein n=1 Tax=Nocardiopsis ganjiahuensis TaxID=239984 RepID=UPI00034DF6B3|nr:HD domain-containing protein [Nocardiopsis ganjiahuensis]